MYTQVYEWNSLWAEYKWHLQHKASHRLSVRFAFKCDLIEHQIIIEDFHRIRKLVIKDKILWKGLNKGERSYIEIPDGIVNIKMKSSLPNWSPRYAPGIDLFGFSDSEWFIHYVVWRYIHRGEVHYFSWNWAKRYLSETDSVIKPVVERLNNCLI